MTLYCTLYDSAGRGSSQEHFQYVNDKGLIIFCIGSRLNESATGGHVAVDSLDYPTDVISLDVDSRIIALLMYIPIYLYLRRYRVCFQIESYYIAGYTRVNDVLAYE